MWCQIFSISSQLVTIPCSIGYFNVKIPLLLCASSPTYESFWPIPTITPWCLGRPTMDGKTALGASSPAKPALTMPEPLSHTSAETSASSAMFIYFASFFTSFYFLQRRSSVLVSFLLVFSCLARVIDEAVFSKERPFV